ncbi:hypothetical protein [Alkaliphilus peptidifermentans]|uniref:Uncharacterized protein n=1 Tax=Alkaliphilus peptidifermentans DSM 18978 TaxID=1120976 RepID=A0A1G5KC36_9FIRM|nr:hypothetical protein [Alkaliphilus peptidifermentans]SCY98185.1 hypothetical protein SAMN03080606_03375 [Alkaliphilus peptidifermentans DSM 18978]
MKTSKELLFHTIHGLFLGFILGLTFSILANELYPDIEAFFNPAYIFPVLSVLGAVLGFIRGYHDGARFLSFVFSTASVIIIPIVLASLLLYLIGLDRLILLPPIIFKTGIGLPMLETQIATYFFSFILTITFVIAFISSLTINKKKRWTW